MIKKIFIGIIILGICFSIYFFSNKQQIESRENILSVGMMEWPPFMTMNQQGEPEGFDVDVACEIAKRLNKKLVITNLGSLAPLFIALEQNKIDILFSGLDITEQRLEKVSMVHYTGAQVTSFTLAFWQKIPTGITNIEDLKNIPNCSVCVEPGSAQEKYLDQCPYLTKKSLPSVIEMVLDIKFGKSHAILLEPRVARRLAKQSPEIVTLTVALPKNFQVYGEGLAIKKNRPVFTTTIANTIQAMKNEGVLKEMELRWGLEE